MTNAHEHTANEPERSEDNVVGRIVNAWDCCGTCAGGVYAASIKPLRERAERAEGECDAVREYAEAERERANKAEAELAALRRRIGETAAEWEACWCGPQMAHDHDPRQRDCPRHGSEDCRHMAEGATRALRALLDGEG